MATQAERRAATRGRIVSAARERFASHGFEATSTSEILADAGVSRGALYHHFETKREVFEAVFLEVSEGAIERAARSVGRGESPLEDLVSASFAWLKEVRKPEVGKILLDQGPQVLGWKRARDLEARTSLHLVKQSLERAADAGEIAVPSIDLAAKLVNALLAEAALARMYDERTRVGQVEETLRRFLSGLRPPA